MRIGELAERSGVAATAIRYYESIGLLAEPRRTPSGSRSYDVTALDRLGFVRRAQSAGLSLDEIGSILEIKDSGGESCEHTRALLEHRLVDLEAQIEAMEATRDELRSLSQRAGRLDPSTCTDPNRCQVLTASDDASDAAAGRKPGIDAD